MLGVEQVAGISAQVKLNGFIDEGFVSELRVANPGVHFTYCLDDDITTGKPVITEDSFNIYLVDGREHCLCLTNDYENATGIVIAEVIDDEE